MKSKFAKTQLSPASGCRAKSPYSGEHRNYCEPCFPGDTTVTTTKAAMTTSLMSTTLPKHWSLVKKLGTISLSKTATRCATKVSIGTGRDDGVDKKVSKPSANQVD